jgi:hypothetical protein
LRIAATSSTLWYRPFELNSQEEHTLANGNLQAVKILKTILWVWATLVLIATAAAVYRGWKCVNLPYELNYGEGPLMWQVLNVWNPSIAYGPLAGGPLVIWNYPPAYLFAVRGLWMVQGDLLWSGRFVSFLSGLGIALLLAAVIYRSLPSRFGSSIRLCAAGVGLLFLCTMPAVRWFPLMRVDWLGLLATYLGIFFFLSAESKHWKTYVAFLFFLLAIWTKQTFLAAPLACFLLTLVTAPRRAIRLGLLCTGLGTAGFWFGMRWTNGGIARHLISYNVHKFSFGRALGGVTSDLSQARLLLILVGGIVIVAVSRVSRMTPVHGWKSWKAKLSRSPFSLALSVEILHALFAFLISFSYGKIGSDINYFLEFDATLCVLSGLSLAVLFWQVQRAPRLSAGLAAALMIPVVLAGQSLGPTFNSLVGSDGTRAMHYECSEAYRQLIPLIANTPGPVVSDDMVLLTRAGKDTVFDPINMWYLAEVGTWDQSQFLGRIESKDFAMIIISDPTRWHPRLLLAIQKAYQVDRVVGQYQVYRPRQ